MPLPTSISEALRLTQAGKLGEATALIRSALGDSLPASFKAPVADAIDLAAERLPFAKTPRKQVEPDEEHTSGSFERRHHSGPAGSIDYMLYRPAAARADMPLVVMLHGCTQSPEDFARGTAMNLLADEFGFLVAYPGQTRTANMQKCWNWFQPGHQTRGQGEPALIVGVTRDVIAAENADPRRVYVAGLSAGGAAAAIMADAYPDLFAAVGIHSGLACGSAKDLPGALAAMKQGSGKQGSGTTRAVRSPAQRFVPVITIHGDRDKTVHEANAREIVAAATSAAGVSVTTEVERGQAGGRAYTRAIARDASGRVLIEQWTVAGAGHAWSGGDPKGSYADAGGPDASRAMIRFFLDHAL